MRPLLAWGLGGATFAEEDETGGLGTPIWPPSRLLGDLELRCGLPEPEVPEALRVDAYATRLETLLRQPTTGETPFYARSFAVDRRGTARELLGWRDELRLAGWDGRAISDGGSRLGTLAAVEALAAPALPAGEAERLRAIEAELARPGATAPYEALRLAEPRATWPARWRRIFACLEAAGCTIEELAVSPVPAASSGSDLAALKARLGALEGSAPELRGDGSLLVLHAETAFEAAEATAALLASLETDDVVVIRSGETTLLDAAFTRQGLATQGSTSPNAFRAPLELLPLALELYYAPRDPQLVLELLELPVSPFSPRVRRALLEALCEAPGVGGRPWRAAKAELADASSASAAGGVSAEELVRVESWLEAPGEPQDVGPSTEALLRRLEEVTACLKARLARWPLDATARAALEQARTADELLRGAAGKRWPRLELRALLDEVLRPTLLRQRFEEAGRLAHVARPVGLLRPRGTVVFWHAVAGDEVSAVRSPFRQAERRALATAGIELLDPAARLLHESRTWHRPAELATRRLLFVLPRRGAGDDLEPHPLLTELRARLCPDEASYAKLTLEARALLEGRGASFGLTLPTETLAPLPLPAQRTSWSIPTGTVLPERLSASALEQLLGCPLRFVLERLARLTNAGPAALPEEVQLYGTLGHRLVEELHARGVSATSDAELSQQAGRLLDVLIETEAGTLLAPGATFDRHHVRGVLLRAVASLARALGAARLAIEKVEPLLEAPWPHGTLQGRLDLLTRTEKGRPAVVDLKWGTSTYCELLGKGQALQLAVYAALAAAGAAGGKRAAELAPAAYFSLSTGQLFASRAGLFPSATVLDEVPLEEVYARLVRTVGALGQHLAEGHAPVLGLANATALAEHLAQKPGAASPLLELAQDDACKYCRAQTLCGKHWEAQP
ncbi:MAG: PD-(D/E)XK nuclease family protein [Deltaproteobacteria bacterium]|nr:PD-(D/E)XK nuclease family protein [Deltaproteobacteria bacterium]